MADVNQYYQSESDYLKAVDLEHGKKYPLTIASESETEFDENGQKSKKLTLAFQNYDKKLALNKTNALNIASVLGYESTLWVGKQIFVFRTMVQFGDKMVDAVRVEMPMQEASINSAPPTSGMVDSPVPEDDIPF